MKTESHMAKRNLELANKIINDDVPMEAFSFTDCRDEVFNLKIK